MYGTHHSHDKEHARSAIITLQFSKHAQQPPHARRVPEVDIVKYRMVLGFNVFQGDLLQQILDNYEK